MKRLRVSSETWRKFLAELLGTFMLVLLGDGAIAQFAMLDAGNRQFLSVSFGYGLALFVGILVSGGVSGGHLNPAVTLAMVSLKRCYWSLLPVYWLAQYLGALLGGAVVYGIYADGIRENQILNSYGSSIFASLPNESATTVTLVMDQILGTAVLVVIILAVTDERNMRVPAGLVPLFIGFGLASIHISLAYNSGCAVNPARDFSPRMVALMAGFGSEVFSEGNHFFWIPWLMPHLGALVGTVTYYFLIEMHHVNEHEPKYDVADVEEPLTA